MSVTFVKAVSDTRDVSDINHVDWQLQLLCLPVMP